MSQVQVISWNIKGLRSPTKRMKILRHLKRLKADVALLQETHLEGKDFFRMQKLWVGKVVGSASIKRKAGTLILLHKDLVYDFISVTSDDEGRRISIHLKLPLGDIRISNIYAPNSPDQNYFARLTPNLYPDESIPHLVGGDFNLTLCDQEDRSKSRRT